VVGLRDGEVINTGGPYVECKEHVGGSGSSLHPTWTQRARVGPQGAEIDRTDNAAERGFLFRRAREWSVRGVVDGG